MSVPATSSTAHRAARIAACDPSTPTTTDFGGYLSNIVNSQQSRALEKLRRTVRITPVADQRPWSSPLDPLFPLVGFEKARLQCVAPQDAFSVAISRCSGSLRPSRDWFAGASSQLLGFPSS